MIFEKLVPNVFYENITDGLKLFVDCLHFTISHDEIKSNQPFCVLEKDHSQLLHPNLKVITLRPWGAKEFAIKDEQVGIIIQEW